MTSQATTLRVWASDFKANDFPAVCAMTGAPAETWHKFHFVRYPAALGCVNAMFIFWPVTLIALLLLPLGPLFVEGIVGRLPLTLPRAKELRIMNYVYGAIYLMGPTFAVAGVLAWVLLAPATSVGNVLFLAGLFFYLCGAIGWHFIKPLFGPAGSLVHRRRGERDDVVEIKRLHPAFVAAVHRMWDARALQQSEPPPTLVESK